MAHSALVLFVFDFFAQMMNIADALLKDCQCLWPPVDFSSESIQIIVCQQSSGRPCLETDTVHIKIFQLTVQYKSANYALIWNILCTMTSF